MHHTNPRRKGKVRKGLYTEEQEAAYMRAVESLAEMIADEIDNVSAEWDIRGEYVLDDVYRVVKSGMIGA